MAKKPTNEKTSDDITSIAARALTKPESLTNAEIRKLGGSALTQAPDHSATSRKKRL